jgi:hypothetical protein
MKKLSLIVLGSLAPLYAFAQGVAAPSTNGGVTQAVGGNVGEIFKFVKNLVNASIGLLVTIALAVFFWGLIRFIFKIGGDSAEAGKEAKNLMVYGVLALFVMVSVWGLVAFIGSFLGISSGGGATINPNSLIPGGVQ